MSGLSSELAILELTNLQEIFKYAEPRVILGELIRSEAVYFSRVLAIIHDIYLKRIILKKVISLDEQIGIFLNIGALYDLSKALNERLQLIPFSAKPYQDVSDILAIFSRDFPIYAKYIYQKDQAIRRLNVNLERNKKFAKIVADDNAACGISLCELLEFPATRSQQYVVYLKAIQAQLDPRDFESYEKLANAIKVLDEVNDDIAKSVRLLSGKRGILDLQKRYFRDQVDLVEEGRYIKKFGLINLVNPKAVMFNKTETVMLIVMNDIAIIASKAGKPKHLVMFQAGNFVDKDDTKDRKNLFRIDGERGKFAFVCDTAQEKEEWIKALNEAIQETREQPFRKVTEEDYEKMVFVKKMSKEDRAKIQEAGGLMAFMKKEEMKAASAGSGYSAFTTSSAFGGGLYKPASGTAADFDADGEDLTGLEPETDGFDSAAALPEVRDDLNIDEIAPYEFVSRASEAYAIVERAAKPSAAAFGGASSAFSYDSSKYLDGTESSSDDPGASVSTVSSSSSSASSVDSMAGKPITSFYRPAAPPGGPGPFPPTGAFPGGGPGGFPSGGPPPTAFRSPPPGVIIPGAAPPGGFSAFPPGAAPTGSKTPPGSFRGALPPGVAPLPGAPGGPEKPGSFRGPPPGAPSTPGASDKPGSFRGAIPGGPTGAAPSGAFAGPSASGYYGPSGTPAPTGGALPGVTPTTVPGSFLPRLPGPGASPVRPGLTPTPPAGPSPTGAPTARPPFLPPGPGIPPSGYIPAPPPGDPPASYGGDVSASFSSGGYSDVSASFSSGGYGASYSAYPGPSASGVFPGPSASGAFPGPSASGAFPGPGASFYTPGSGVTASFAGPSGFAPPGGRIPAPPGGGYGPAPTFRQP